MKWSIRLREQKDSRGDAPYVWWIRQADAERKIKELKKEISNLKSAND